MDAHRLAHLGPVASAAHAADSQFLPVSQAQCCAQHPARIAVRLYHARQIEAITALLAEADAFGAHGERHALARRAVAGRFDYAAGKRQRQRACLVAAGDGCSKDIALPDELRVCGRS